MTDDDSSERAQAQTDETTRCPTCGQRPVPETRTMWNALTTKIAADAWNIAAALTMIYALFLLLHGVPRWEHFVYVGFAFVALLFADLLAIVHQLMKLGFPFRQWTEPGSDGIEL